MLEQPRGDLAITGGYVHYSANLGLSWSDGIAIATSVIGFAYLILADCANPSIYASGSPGNLFLHAVRFCHELPGGQTQARSMSG
jgi:hypothetical protein